MNISSVKVKEYNSTNKHILMVEGKPICIVRGNKSLNDCISYLIKKCYANQKLKSLRCPNCGAKMDGGKTD